MRCDRLIWVLVAISAWLAAPLAGESVDFADPANRQMWLAHPVIGDVSYDSFVRVEHNPIYVGTPPYEWPVNGFLFRDSKTGNLYCHISLYPRGYWPAGPSRLIRSRDRGKTWEDLGIALQGDKDSFDGDGTRAGATLDATIAEDRTGYHMAYGWAKPDNSDGGIAYAFSKTPEGPFVRDPEPIHAESKQPLIPPGYKRVYASTIIRRQKDWLILASMSTPRNAGGMWAFVGMIAPEAKGPYTPPIFLRSPQSGEFFPQPVEFCPAFVHGPHVYAALTSVAANRGYQLLLRAEIEQAHKPEAWSVFQAGSAFHAEPTRSEAFGIWGQSFSGFVDDRGWFNVMFPSRDSNNVGTINLASRRWDEPLQKGFWLSGSNGPALGLIMREYQQFRLECDLSASGSWRVVWNHRAPLGPDRPIADAVPSPLTLANLTSLSVSDTMWKVETVAADGRKRAKSVGAQQGGGKSHHVEIEQLADKVRIVLDGQDLPEADLPAIGGGLGLVAEKGACLNVRQFKVEGEARPISYFLLPLEGLLGAGQLESAWTRKSTGFHFTSGYIAATEGARAKWNFTGHGAALWSPRGPDYGEANIVVDGKPAGRVRLHAETQQDSAVVWSDDNLPPGQHAVMIVRENGAMPVDSLEFRP